MNELCTGVVTKITDGRFDNQYQVEITLLDGTKFGGFDGISVYEKKQDGSPAKVWPLVQESKFQSKPFTWQGNVKESNTQGGPKRYATITWASPVDGNAWTNGEGGENSGWGAPTDQASTDTSLVSKTSGEVSRGTPSATSKDDYWERREAQDEQRTREIESAWAIGLLIHHVEPDKLHQEVHRLIVFKHQIAKELADD